MEPKEIIRRLEEMAARIMKDPECSGDDLQTLAAAQAYIGLTAERHQV